MHARRSGPPAARAENLAVWRAARSADEEKLLTLVQRSLDDVGGDARSWVHARRLNWAHDRRGTTPLMAAAAHRRGAAAVQVLLAARCVDVDAPDGTRLLNTALHYAAASAAGDAAAVESLLRAGADPFRLNRRGHLPLDEARVHGRNAAAKALLERMAVHADWLYVRGRLRWKKRWAVLVACDEARAATELCVYKTPGHARPEAVVLVDERAEVIPFAATDSHRWLKHPFAFTTDKPVMWQSVKRQKFTRAPSCRKTITHEHADTQHVIFAAEDKEKQLEWMQALTPPPSADADDSAGAESYYWPRETANSRSNSAIQAPIVPAPEFVIEPPILLPHERRRSSTPTASRAPTSVPTITSPRQNDRGRARSEPPVFRFYSQTRRSRTAEANRSSRSSGLSELDDIATPTAERRPSLVDAQSEDEQEGGRESDTDSSSASLEPTTPIAAAAADNATPAEDSTSLSSNPQESGSRTSEQRHGTCLICVSAPRDAVCAPCGHLAACHSCLLTSVQTFRQCPICRARVQAVIRIYDA